MNIKEILTKRLDFIDSLKGVAIFLMVWGHSIQYLRDGADFIHNPVFEIIYSFHMPLFFLMSGFFFNSSLKLNLKDFLKGKFLQLLLPVITWAALYWIVQMVHENKFDLMAYTHLQVRNVEWPFWFLRELFISYVLVYVAYKIFKNKWVVYIISISIVLIAPYCGMQRFLLPLFLAGIFLKDNYPFFLKHINWVILVSGVVFLVSLFFWNGEYTIYRTPFEQLIDWKTLSFTFINLDIALFRLLIGLAGSVFFFLLFQMYYKDNWINIQFRRIGIQTLSIYILQYTLLEKIANRFVDFSMVNSWMYNLVITPLFSLLILVVCVWIRDMMSKRKYLLLILFGCLIKKKEPVL